jgi:hypothetical protein
VPWAAFPDTSSIKAAKVMSVAGAYWRGDEKRKQLTRLYAITFPKQKELDEYLMLWKRPRSATTASWARNWTSSPSASVWARACRCGCRKARHCASG